MRQVSGSISQPKQPARPRCLSNLKNRFGRKRIPRPPSGRARRPGAASARKPAHGSRAKGTKITLPAEKIPAPALPNQPRCEPKRNAAAPHEWQFPPSRNWAAGLDRRNPAAPHTCPHGRGVRSAIKAARPETPVRRWPPEKPSAPMFGVEKRPNSSTHQASADDPPKFWRFPGPGCWTGQATFKEFVTNEEVACLNAPPLFLPRGPLRLFQVFLPDPSSASHRAGPPSANHP